jgi:hypothetical protein
MIAFGAPLHQEDRMSKKIMWASVLAGAFAPLVLYWLQNIADDNHPGLTGTTRSTFVEGAIGTCLKKANGDPANKGISPSLFLNTATATPTSWRTASPSKN